MEAILNSASSPSDLLNISDSSLPYRFDRIFTAEGFGARRLEKKRLRLMKGIDPLLKSFLAEGEKVDFVTWGVEYSFAEQFFMGIWAQLFNRRALVFTDRRILILQISSRHKVLDLKMQIRFQAIDGFAKRTFGYIGLVLRNGKRFLITGMPGKDRKAIRSILEERIAATRADAPGVGIDNLCPRCGTKVLDYPDRCKQCTQAFKSGRKAGWLSLAFPGLGDIYLGHRWLGISEIFGALIAWAAIVAPVTMATLEEGGPWIVPAGVAAAIFAIVHGTDSWITRRMGFKGIYPDK